MIDGLLGGHLRFEFTAFLQRFRGFFILQMLFSFDPFFFHFGLGGFTCLFDPSESRAVFVEFTPAEGLAEPVVGTFMYV